MRCCSLLLLATTLSIVGLGCGQASAPDDASAPDAPSPSDASPSDAAPSDAAAVADTGLDAFAADAPMADASLHDAWTPCEPSRVRYVPSGGELAEGHLCDDVFACVASTTDAASLVAVAPDFVCTTGPEGPCPAVSCRYPTSTLDAAEVAEVCRVTTLLYVTDLVCMVYL